MTYVPARVGGRRDTYTGTRAQRIVVDGGRGAGVEARTARRRAAAGARASTSIVAARRDPHAAAAAPRNGLGDASG